MNLLQHASLVPFLSQSAPSPQKAAPSNPSGATLQPRAASGAYEDARPPDEQGREEDLVASIAKSMQPKGLERAKTAGLSSELRYELAKVCTPNPPPSSLSYLFGHACVCACAYAGASCMTFMLQHAGGNEDWDTLAFAY